MTAPELTVVYHVATMCAWVDLVSWQLRELRRNGLEHVLLTHVGPGLQSVREAAVKEGVTLDVRFDDPNISHYETPAMFLIQELAKRDGAVLYLHTKGVSQPHSWRHARWRELMHVHVINKWREHLDRLDYKDLVGLDWIEQGHGEGHFSGNFWLARLDYLRRCPDYGAFHVGNGLTRFSAEQWPGRGKPPPRVHSEYVMNVQWQDLCRL